MYKYKTRKREEYYDEVMRLHFELGYGEDRIARILPIGHTTVGRWIANFVSEQKTDSAMKEEKSLHSDSPGTIRSVDVKSMSNLPAEEQIERLKAALLKAEMRADLSEEIINVAEDKFGIRIRKKVGAKR